MTTTPLGAQRLRGIAFTTVIGATFGAFWGINGSAALPGIARILATLLVVAITLIWLGLAYTFQRAARHLPNMPDDLPNPFLNRTYWFAVLAQSIAIPVVARLLIIGGYPDAIISAVALIVGLHFFGLIPAFRSWNFALVGGAMALLAVISLALAPQIMVGTGGATIALRAAVVGLGCALILWAGILPVVATTRRQLIRQRA